MENSTEKKRVLAFLKKNLNDLFNLHNDKEREETTIAEVKKNVEFKGANLWILIFAIFIASIGLNVNSTAVIIGAMLISPLMGPIIGIGVGAGINDLRLIRTAMKNLGIAILISVITSTIYFYFTPLHEAQSELLARTYPTLWDVLIAFFGGLSGIVAGSRKEKSNAIPGVAIATALMPPLCTAGYGLANGNLYYFVGAFYLFFINSVFISVSTFLMVRFLKYPKHQFESKEVERKVKVFIWIFVMITAIPSTYLAYNLVKRTIFEQNAKNFVKSSFEGFNETQVINQKFLIENNKQIIELTLYGRPLSPFEIKTIENSLPLFNLKNATVRVMQGYQEDLTQATQQEFYKMSQEMKLNIIEDLYKKNDDLIKTKDDQIKVLENKILDLQKTIYPIQDIKSEMTVQYPNLKSLSIGDLVTSTNDTICHAFAHFTRRPGNTDRKKIEDWLKIRTKTDSIIVIIQ